MTDGTSSDLRHRYEAAAREAAQGIAATDDIIRRMRVAVDAIWTHLSPTGVSWVGFYVPQTDPTEADSLILGPSRDRPACSPIGLHGVCGQSFRGRCVRIVHDVQALGDDYVACDPRDRSEIVIPIQQGEATIAVLDLDSHEVGRFTPADEVGLRLVLQAAGLSQP